MSTAGTIILIIVVVVLAAIIVGGWYAARRRALRKRFGPEYDRLVAEQNSRSAAEHELRERERKHAALDLRPLSVASRAQYAADWAQVQARFVDNPSAAVREGDALVTRLVGEIGYPTDSDDERLALLSVEHADTLGTYRAAHEISVRNERGEASTEELRQALVHYRALFAELLGDEPVPTGISASDPAPHAGANGTRSGPQSGAPSGAPPGVPAPRPAEAPVEAPVKAESSGAGRDGGAGGAGIESGSGSGRHSRIDSAVDSGVDNRPAPGTRAR